MQTAFLSLSAHVPSSPILKRHGSGSRYQAPAAKGASRYQLGEIVHGATVVVNNGMRGVVTDLDKRTAWVESNRRIFRFRKCDMKRVYEGDAVGSQPPHAGHGNAYEANVGDGEDD